MHQTRMAPAVACDAGQLQLLPQCATISWFSGCRLSGTQTRLHTRVCCSAQGAVRVCMLGVSMVGVAQCSYLV
jgi:hypothetical protein